MKQLGFRREVSFMQRGLDEIRVSNRWNYEGKPDSKENELNVKRGGGESGVYF